MENGHRVKAFGHCFLHLHVGTNVPVCRSFSVDGLSLRGFPESLSYFLRKGMKKKVFTTTIFFNYKNYIDLLKNIWKYRNV